MKHNEQLFRKNKLTVNYITKNGEVENTEGVKLTTKEYTK